MDTSSGHSRIDLAAQQAAARRTELINCHDCGKGVSFSATVCPHCGSVEPQGPYVQSVRELRRHRIEARNDRTLVVAVLSCGLGGLAYGLVMASSLVGKMLLGSGYGLLGVIIGVPVAFVINMTRHLGR
jgi:hypothetical protein